MKRHLTLATRREYARRHAQTAGPSVIEAPQFASAHPPEWKHTLILTGRLDYYSAPELEDEIDCLREEGVTTLTVDLRELDGIDATGVQVVAAQGALFKEGGRDFLVIAGELLGPGFADDEPVRHLMARTPSETAPRFTRARRQGNLPERSIAMVQHLAPIARLKRVS